MKIFYSIVSILYMQNIFGNAAWYLETELGINGLPGAAISEHGLEGSQIGNKNITKCLILNDVLKEEVNGIIKIMICETIFPNVGFILKHTCPMSIKLNEKSYGEWHTEFYKNHTKSQKFRLFCKGE